jgi:hypothetical protein
MDQRDFSYLISPTSVSDFLAQYWEQSPLFLKRDEADRYQGLLDAADAEAVLAMANSLPSEALDVVGRILPGDGSREPVNALADLFAKGATIRVRALERFAEPLGELCRNLETAFSFPVHANLYCTPANSRGFDLHFDTHEVFVLQLFGKKHWQVYEPTTQPSEPASARSGGKTSQDINEADAGALVLEALLEPGDCLYLPRGFVHRADSRDEPSVHLTIGVHVIEESGESSAATDDDRSIDADHDAALIDSETKLESNGLLRFYLAADGTTAGLANHEHEMWLPVSFAPALRFVTEQKSFSAHDIPGSMTDHGKLAFVRHLLRNNFLRLAR